MAQNLLEILDMPIDSLYINAFFYLNAIRRIENRNNEEAIIDL